MATTIPNTRLDALKHWLVEQGFDISTLSPLNGDASFRHYFRLQHVGQPYIVMDAPPDKEKPQAFYDLSLYLANHGIHTPSIFKADTTLGYMVLEDFGDQLLSQINTDEDKVSYYTQAIDIAAKFLQISTQSTKTILHLPNFNHATQIVELNLFNDWFIKQYLARELSRQEQDLLSQSYHWIIDKLLSQPQVFVHRDFHCRNLMVLKDGLGVIDFQDAVIGPYTYDLVSLIKDAYTDFAYEQQTILLPHFWEQMPATIKEACPYPSFTSDLRLTGIQRHLKVIGIFARLYCRDGKAGYLADIPRVFKYLLQALEETPELSSLSQWLLHEIMPQYQQELCQVS